MKNSTPDRLACVDLPAFPLQLLLKRHPRWKAHPVAVVAEDKPQGVILWVNQKARESGVLPGFRYAAAFSLAPSLRAGEVSPVEIEKATADLTYCFMRFSPEVEPSSDEAGVFWLNLRGLKSLYASPQQWAKKLRLAIEACVFHPTIVVGFTRFGSYAVAKEKKGVIVFRNPAEERNEAQKISLDRFDIDADFRDTLFKLGIKTVGALLSLSPGALRERFGAKAHQLYRLAANDFWTPLNPRAPEDPIMHRRILDFPENDAIRLLFIIKQLLHPMLSDLAARAQALTILWLSFLIEKSSWIKEQIRPAAPTLNIVQILDLVRLRLESIKFSAGIIEITLEAEGYAATTEQLLLFNKYTARDLDAANRALARLRAEFGENTVVRAVLKDGHLPEASFAWEPLARVDLPKNGLKDLNPSTAHKTGSAEGLNGLNGLPVAIRRITAKPILLPGAPYPTHEDGWLLLGTKYGSIDKLIGPYIISGGWWNHEIHREYYYAETRHGDLLWVYFDRRRRRWLLQGTIE